MPYFKHGSPGLANGAGVYLPRLPYEESYAASSAPGVRYQNQDALIMSSMRNQDNGATVLRSAASTEATVFSRYGVVLRQYLDLLTGFPEWFK